MSYAEMRLIDKLAGELKDAERENAELRKLVEQMRTALKLALLFVPDNAVDAIRMSEAALEATERGGE